MSDFIAWPRSDVQLDTCDLTRKRLGLHYSAPDGSARPFDLYYPERGAGPFPLVISISGGGWYFGTPSSIHLGALIHTCVARGYAVASIACTSSGTQKFPYQILEARSALRQLRRRAAELLLDPNWAALWGASSGGHLALMTALTQGIPAFDSEGTQALGSDAVQALVAIYPCCKIGSTTEEFTAIGLQPAFDRSGPRCMDSIFLGAPIEDSPSLCRTASAQTYLRPDAPPLLLLHGTADTTVPYSSSADFVAGYRAVAGAEQVLARFVTGAVHSDPRFKSRETCGKIVDFLDRVRTGQLPCPPELRQTAPVDCGHIF